MSELTQNTVNFCYHHRPFRTLPQTDGTVRVTDQRGLIICTCNLIDDAWTIAEALNHIGVSGAKGQGSGTETPHPERGSVSRSTPEPTAGHRPALPENS